LSMVLSGDIKYWSNLLAVFGVKKL
jgi:hypothetical protein